MASDFTRDVKEQEETLAEVGEEDTGTTRMGSETLKAKGTLTDVPEMATSPTVTAHHEYRGKEIECRQYPVPPD